MKKKKSNLLRFYYSIVAFYGIVGMCWAFFPQSLIWPVYLKAPFWAILSAVTLVFFAITIYMTLTYMHTPNMIIKRAQRMEKRIQKKSKSIIELAKKIEIFRRYIEYLYVRSNKNKQKDKFAPLGVDLSKYFRDNNHSANDKPFYYGE